MKWPVKILHLRMPGFLRVWVFALAGAWGVVLAVGVLRLSRCW